MKPSYRPRNKRRINKHGFRARMADRWGRAVLSRRRKKGRKRLTVSHSVEARGLLTPAERLPRARRLARASDIRRCLTGGRRRRFAHLDMIWTDNTTGHPRMGLIVPKFQVHRGGPQSFAAPAAGDLAPRASAAPAGVGRRDPGPARGLRRRVRRAPRPSCSPGAPRPWAAR